MNVSEHLGWALIHFVWEGALIAVLYSVARTCSSHAQARYAIGCAALACMMAAPIVTWLVLGEQNGMTTVGQVSSRISPLRDAVDNGNFTQLVRAAGSVERSEALMSWVVIIWLVGASGFWIRFMGGWAAAMRLRSRQVRAAPDEWQVRLTQLGSRIGLARPVQLMTSAIVHGPVVVGWVRPVVLVPLGALTSLPPDQIESLLAHELAHVLRHDYLVNLLQGVAEALLFYHPAVWWISGQIRIEREFCCDDVAVSVSGDTLRYASALAELESLRSVACAPAVAASGGSLVDRIGRLTGHSRTRSRRWPGTGIALSGIVLAIAAFGVFGQTSDLPRFDVASIKPSPPAGRAMYFPEFGDGKLRAVSVPVRLLMQQAFGVKPFQILGSAGSIDSDRYDISAKSERNTAPKDMPLMLQSLLKDRFQLKFHRETRELGVYFLAPAKGGLKLSEPQSGSCVDASPLTPPPPPSPPPCGIVRMRMSPTDSSLDGGKASMARLAFTLSNILGRAIIDKTGFQGTFDIHVQFAPDESLVGLPTRPGEPAAPVDPLSHPSIFTALQEQAGLKLEAGKGPVEVIVIDRIEKPSGN